ncbi:MAG: hypothetical protein OQK97_10045 [Deltaproteobacteria bacterium]|nr:hypothetical protein [Deltaproteobacteria bacterium]
MFLQADAVYAAGLPTPCLRLRRRLLHRSGVAGNARACRPVCTSKRLDLRHEMVCKYIQVAAVLPPPQGADNELLDAEDTSRRRPPFIKWYRSAGRSLCMACAISKVYSNLVCGCKRGS